MITCLRYFARFFVCASELGIHGLPEGADASFFLCKELDPGYLSGVNGEYAPPEGYFIAEREPEAFERFDAQFPPKEKLKLRVRFSEILRSGKTANVPLNVSVERDAVSCYAVIPRIPA